jgi:hypothetical protein
MVIKESAKAISNPDFEKGQEVTVIGFHRLRIGGRRAGSSFSDRSILGSIRRTFRLSRCGGRNRGAL